jgi:hypothetical protein
MNKRKQKKLGRPTEAPGLRTRDLMHLASELDCNPFEVLLYFAKGDYGALGYEEKKKIITKDSSYEEYTISPELRQKAAKDACEYLFPKRKAIEHTINPKTLEDKELLEETRRLLAEAEEATE